MPFRVTLPESVATRIASFPLKVAENIRARLTMLEADPRPGWVKRLKGSRTLCFRTGKYRVLYEVDDAAKTIHVLDADKRSDVYRDL